MSLEQPPRSRPRERVRWITVIVSVLVTLGILSYLVYLGYGVGWTGLGESRVQQNVEPSKTLWEWLGLLFVPAMLAAGGVLLNRMQKQHDELVEQEQRKREEAAAIQRAQDEALRQYLDQMSDLMVDRELRKKLREEKLHEEPDDPDERRIAQARTLAILLGLDKDRKRLPLKLIYELNLIMKEEPILNLKNAGLDTADLSEITLHDACLREADLRRAKLRGADLRGTDLTGADLRGADLSDANLSDTVLAGANLLPYDKTNPAKLNAPNLSNGTDPSDIDPTDDHVISTNLSDADLSNVDLSGAYLTGAEVSEEQLNTCKSLKGAIMPNGQKYEEWLKSRGENGKNGGPP